MNTPTTNKPKDTLIPGKKSIDAFIDNLIEGEESIIQDVNKVLLRRCYCKESLKLETCLLLI